MPKTVYLNIDWDFFVQEDPSWDWGHAEIALFQDIMWPIRAMSFAAQGLNLREEMSPNRSYPAPKDLSTFLIQTMGLKFAPNCSVIVQDSHGKAGQYYVEQDLVVNIDAHHDCGYHDRAVLQRRWAEGQLEAGSWLWDLLVRHPSLEARVLYPAWKQWVDYEGTDFEATLTNAMRERLQFNVVDEDTDYSEYQGAIVTDIFLARSGAWTPPWTDVQFNELEHKLCNLAHQYFAWATLSPRDFDWEQLYTAIEEMGKVHDDTQR